MHKKTKNYDIGFNTSKHINLLSKKKIFSILNASRKILPIKETSSSANTEGPHDALSQLKSCELLHNCTKNLI